MKHLNETKSHYDISCFLESTIVLKPCTEEEIAIFQAKTLTKAINFLKKEMEKGPIRLRYFAILVKKFRSTDLVRAKCEDREFYKNNIKQLYNYINAGLSQEESLKYSEDLRKLHSQMMLYSVEYFKESVNKNGFDSEERVKILEYIENIYEKYPYVSTFTTLIEARKKIYSHKNGYDINEVWGEAHIAIASKYLELPEPHFKSLYLTYLYKKFGFSKAKSFFSDLSLEPSLLDSFVYCAILGAYEAEIKISDKEIKAELLKEAEDIYAKIPGDKDNKSSQVNKGMLKLYIAADIDMHIMRKFFEESLKKLKAVGGKTLEQNYIILMKYYMDKSFHAEAGIIYRLAMSNGCFAKNKPTFSVNKNILSFRLDLHIRGETGRGTPYYNSADKELIPLILRDYFKFIIRRLDKSPEKFDQVLITIICGKPNLIRQDDSNSIIVFVQDILFNFYRIAAIISSDNAGCLEIKSTESAIRINSNLGKFYEENNKLYKLIEETERDNQFVKYDDLDQIATIKFDDMLLVRCRSNKRNNYQFFKLYDQKPIDSMEFMLAILLKRSYSNNFYEQLIMERQVFVEASSIRKSFICFSTLEQSLSEEFSLHGIKIDLNPKPDLNNAFSGNFCLIYKHNINLQRNFSINMAIVTEPGADRRLIRRTISAAVRAYFNAEGYTGLISNNNNASENISSKPMLTLKK